MKIGEKVRFLNEVGGGIITGFKDKYTVLVKDSDGFEVPTLAKDCVVIETNNYNIAKVNTTLKEPAVKSKPIEVDISEKPITFKPKPIERKGGDELNIYLAYVPMNINKLSTTHFETYLINDSNYSLHFSYLSKEGSKWKVRSIGIAEPNLKMFLEEFSHEELNNMEQVVLQFFAYKEDKTFTLKTPVSVKRKLNGKNFYKLHTFENSDFFEDKAIIYPIIENEESIEEEIKEENIAKEIQNALTTNGYKEEEKEKEIEIKTREKEKQKKDIIEIDLHANEILDTTAGMTNTDILSYQVDIFKKTMKQYCKKKGQKIIVIHGKGEGVLRNAVINVLKRGYPTCNFQDASFQEYGFGATLINIR